MLHTHITRMLQTCLHLRMVKQVVVTPTGDKAESRALDLGERRGVAVQPVKAEERLGGRSPLAWR